MYLLYYRTVNKRFSILLCNSVGMQSVWLYLVYGCPATEKVVRSGVFVLCIMDFFCYQFHGRIQELIREPHPSPFPFPSSLLFPFSSFPSLPLLTSSLPFLSPPYPPSVTPLLVFLSHSIPLSPSRGLGKRLSISRSGVPSLQRISTILTPECTTNGDNKY